jgi:hypothetical protein
MDIQKRWLAAPDMWLNLRQASLDDIDAIMEVEKNWGEEGRADVSVFISRLTKFPQGCFIAFDDAADKPVATITCCPAVYDGKDLSQYASWNKATNLGVFSDDLTSDRPFSHGENALYIASGVIDEIYRGADIFAPLVSAIVQRAEQLNLDFVIAGAVIPGYKRYCEKYGKASAAEYVFMRRGSSLADPLLSMYEKIGFHVPNAEHVKAEYFPDDASLNYAALVVRDLKKVSTGK